MEREQYIPQFDIAEQLSGRLAEENNNETEALLHSIVVRALAKARREARKAIEITDDWRPELDDFAGSDDTEVLQRAIERAEVIQMLDSYLNGIIEGHIETILLEDQVATMESIYDFLVSEYNEVLNDGSPLGALTKTGYLELATNYGKTIILIELLKAIDAGKTRSGLKTLVLINNRANVLNFIGTSSDGPTGVAKFAPELNVHGLLKARYDKDWQQQDIVVMTYDMFRNRFIAGDMAGFDAGLILADEGHRALGEETRAAFDAYSKGKLSLFLTATPESGGKHLDQITENKITLVEPKTLIETGRASEVQLFGVATRQKAKIVPSNRVEFTERELQSLRRSPERSQLAIEIATVFASEGRRVLVHCIPGDECSHAVAIAKALDGQEVYDTSIEQKRILVAKAIHGYMPNEEQDRVLRAFKNGEIDILAQVNTLNESFDSSYVEAVIHARPVKSPRLGKQQFGRGMRHNRWGRTVHCYMLDDIEGGAQQYTGFHVLNEDRFEQGMVIGRKEPRDLDNGQVVQLKQRKPVAPKGDSPEPQGLSEEGYRQLEARLGDEAVNVTVVRELMVGRKEVFEESPEGWLPLRQFTDWGAARELDIQAVQTILVKEGGFECKLVNIRRGTYMYFVPAAAKAFLDTYEMVEWAPSGYLTAHKFMEKMMNEGVPVTFMLLEKILENNPIESVMYRCRLTRRKLPHYSPEEQDKLKAILQERAARVAPAEGKIALSDLAREVGQQNGAVQFYLRRHYGVEGETFISAKTNKEAFFYDDKYAEIVRYHFKYKIAPKRAVFIDALKEEYSVSDAEIDNLISNLGLSGYISEGRATGKAAMEVAATVYGKYLPEKRGRELEEALKTFVFNRDLNSVMSEEKPSAEIDGKFEAAKTARDETYSYGRLLIETDAEEKYVLAAMKRIYGGNATRRYSRYGSEALMSRQMFEHLVQHFSAIPNAPNEWWCAARVASEVKVAEEEVIEAVKQLVPPQEAVRLFYSSYGEFRRLAPHFHERFAEVLMDFLLNQKRARG